MHHGLLWDGNVPVTGRRYRRVAALLENDVALYTRPTFRSIFTPRWATTWSWPTGWASRSEGWFGDYKGQPDRRLGVRLAPAHRRDALLGEVNRALGTFAPGARLIAGGPDRVSRVGIITGGAGSMIGEARAAGSTPTSPVRAPTTPTSTPIEWGLNVIYAGHYATETLGVQALASHLGERFDLDWEFHDHPTGL